jgi:hypothetical protein
MAVTVQLTDGTNTVDLNDGTTFTTRNISMPTPSYRTAMAGVGNLDRSGSYLLAQSYNNRSISLNVMVDGTSMDNLIAKVNTVHDILRRATDFSQHGFGSQVYLNYQQDGATNAVRFNVIQGTYDPLSAVDFPALNISDVLINTTVTLACEPFGVMAQETLSNYVDNPSFEVAGTNPSTDWTQAHTATGTSANDTTEYIFGATSLKLVMTDSTSGGEWIGRYQDITSAAAVTWSLYFWGRLDAASNSVLKLVVEFLDSSGNVLLEEEWILDSTSSTDYSRLVVTEIKSPANTATLRVSCRLESSDVDATGTAFIDGWFADQVTTFPVAWMAGRAVYNNLEGETGPDSQEEINYFDIYDVPGDIPSLMQIKLAENEAHTDLWLGARHAGRLLDTGIWHQGNQFVGDDGLSTSGIAGLWDASSAGSASTNAASPTIASEVVTTPAVGQYRVLSKIRQGATDRYRAAMGYTLGAVTVDPSVAADYGTVQQGAMGILDLGSLTISKPPENMTIGSLTLRLAFYVTSSMTSEDLVLEHVFLLPVDFGSMIVNKSSNQDVILVDGISRHRMAILLNTSDVVQSIPPNQSGLPPQVHPLGTRIYLVSDNGAADIDDGWKATIILEHRFLSLRGA